MSIQSQDQISINSRSSNLQNSKLEFRISRHRAQGVLEMHAPIECTGLTLNRKPRVACRLQFAVCTGVYSRGGGEAAFHVPRRFDSSICYIRPEVKCRVADAFANRLLRVSRTPVSLDSISESSSAAKVRRPLREIRIAE